MNVKKWLAYLLVMLFLVPATSATNLHADQFVPVERPGGIAYKKAGFLLVAPDRGFAGNQKVRKSFQALHEKRNAELVFITDQRMQPYLEQALKNLKDNNAQQIVVLPLFLSISHPKLEMFRLMLQRLTSDQNIIYARPFGNSYLAVEMLSERLQAVELAQETPLVLIAHGATTERSLKRMQRDFTRIADAALENFEGSERENDTINVVVLPGRSENYKAQNKQAWSEIKKAAEEQGSNQVLPFHMGSELSGMMSVNAWLEDKLPAYKTMVEFEDNEVEFFSLWMQREANRYLSAKEAPLGMVFLAHGSDFHWNQGMRDAAKSLTEKYPVEFSFSMADAEDLRQSVASLEQRGVGVIVIVRVFGMRASFRHAVERLIGLDVDAPELCMVPDEDDIHEGGWPMRLRTTALVVTEGGLGDSPLFARAMLERAKALSDNPEKDTVIVVAHGKDSGTANQQWLNVLNSLTTQMKAMGGDQFKDILYQTWQEDWEDKRGARIESVLAKVNAANESGGTAIIIPARTTGEGRSRSFLKSAEFKAGKGFAPHPLFVEWVEQQFLRGTETLDQTRHVWYPALMIKTINTAGNEK